MPRGSQLSALHIACEAGLERVVSVLAPKAGPQGLELPANRSIPLGDYGGFMVRVMMWTSVNWDAHKWGRRTPLHMACEMGHYTVARVLV